MNPIRVFACRVYQGTMSIAMRFLSFNEPKAIEGLASIPDELVLTHKKKPLIVTDPAIFKLGFTKPLEEALAKKSIGYSIFSDVVPNPTFECIYAALKVAKDNSCDSIVAIGGGSSMDCAKAVGALLANPRKDLMGLKGTLKVTHPYKALIAVPTTAGTGSEATVAAVVVNEKTHQKFAINDPHLIPKVACFDDTLLAGLPKKVISTTGMDALTHAVEAYIGHTRTKKTKRYSIEAVQLINDYLFRFYIDPSDTEARKKMQRAAYLAGVSFTRSYVGYVHAIAHSLGGMYNVPHGLANAIILPYVLKEYGKKAIKPLASLASSIGLEGRNEEEKAKAFIAWIENMNKKMDIPDSFDGLIKEKDIDTLSSYADKEGNPLYPVPKEMSKEELAGIYRKIDKAIE